MRVMKLEEERAEERAVKLKLDMEKHHVHLKQMKTLQETVDKQASELEVVKQRLENLGIPKEAAPLAELVKVDCSLRQLLAQRPTFTEMEESELGARVRELEKKLHSKLGTEEVAQLHGQLEALKDNFGTRFICKAELSEFETRMERQVARKTSSQDTAQLADRLDTLNKYFESQFTRKVNKADLDEMLANKLDLAGVDTRVGELMKNKFGQEEGQLIHSKVEAISGFVESLMSRKANTDDTQAALATKVDLTELEQRLALKANEADMKASFARKSEELGGLLTRQQELVESKIDKIDMRLLRGDFDALTAQFKEVLSLKIEREMLDTIRAKFETLEHHVEAQISRKATQAELLELGALLDKQLVRKVDKEDNQDLRKRVEALSTHTERMEERLASKEELEAVTKMGGDKLAAAVKSFVSQTEMSEALGSKLDLKADQKDLDSVIFRMVTKAMVDDMLANMVNKQDLEVALERLGVKQVRLEMESQLESCLSKMVLKSVYEENLSTKLATLQLNMREEMKEVLSHLAPLDLVNKGLSKKVNVSEFSTKIDCMVSVDEMQEVLKQVVSQNTLKEKIKYFVTLDEIKEIFKISADPDSLF